MTKEMKVKDIKLKMVKLDCGTGQKNELQYSLTISKMQKAQLEASDLYCSNELEVVICM